MSTVRVAIGLGSNLGRRLTLLKTAVEALEAFLTLRRCSAVYETEPMGIREQPVFLNACCVGDTRLPARSLLEALQDIERRAGRRRDGPRFGPRELDLDLLFYGDMVIADDDLTVPHPRMAERPFVLWPLAEIAGFWIHPETETTVAVMAAQLPRGNLRRYAGSAALLRAGS